MKNFLLLGVALLCFSCKDKASDEHYYFTEAQPVNDSELSEFPSRFLGTYQTNDSTFLNIQKKMVLSESYTRFKIPKTALDTLKNEFDFDGKKLVSKTTREYYDVVALGDSLQLSIADVDTVFMFSGNQKAKKVNGNLVLSRKDSVYWKVEWLLFQKDRLKTNRVFSKEDLKRVDSLSKKKAIALDSSKYLLQPTRREFVRMMELNNFGSERNYKKINHKKT